MADGCSNSRPFRNRQSFKDENEQEDVEDFLI